MDGWMDGWGRERRASERPEVRAPGLRPHVRHASLPPCTCSDHTISMTRWLPRTHVRGFEKLGANAKIDLRPFLSLSLGSLPRDR